MPKPPPVDTSPPIEVKRLRVPSQSRQVDTGPPTDEAIAAAASYGVPLGTLGVRDKHMWQSQEAYLAELREVGMKGTSAIRAGIHRETARLWERGNQLNFNARLLDAMEVYVDLHEERLTELALNTNQVLPSIATLNARRPELYRREQVASDTRVSEALAAIKVLVSAEARQRALTAGDEQQSEQAMAEQVIEGKGRVVEDA